MTIPTRTLLRRAVITMAVLLNASTVCAQDTLARAKDFYAQASYEDALQVLDRLQAAKPSDAASEIAAYQVYCLVALGRNDRVKQAIVDLVKIDPLFHPSESLVSPRVRTLFEETRRPLVPQLARQVYNKAKAEYDRKEMAGAKKDFDKAIALLDELADSDDPSNADMRTLAAGFRDLAENALKPAPAPAPSAPPQPPPAPVPATPGPANDPPPSAATTTAGTSAQPPASNPASSPAKPAPKDDKAIFSVDDTDVRRPVVISQPMPIWAPANTFEAKNRYSGILEVVVGEDGTVVSASMKKSALASYDALLLNIAPTWKFKPATRNGTPVKYRIDLGVQVGK